jgi:pyruvate/2-oxoacid:ferredoxin oxidoreductase alpha subunit
MTITQVVLHSGFAKVHYSNGGRLIVSTNEAIKLATQYTVPVINA